MLLENQFSLFNHFKQFPIVQLIFKIVYRLKKKKKSLNLLLEDAHHTALQHLKLGP